MNTSKVFKKTLLSLLFFSLLITIAYPVTVKAAISDPLEFEPQIGIPGVYEKGYLYPLKEKDTSHIAKMIKGFYNYGIGIAGILAAIMLMAGGLIWLTSAGNSEKITQAKNIMSGSVIGLVILFSSWMLLRTINPALVDFRITDIENLEGMQSVNFCSSEGIVNALCLNGVCKNEKNETLVGSICTEQENCVKISVKEEKNVFGCKEVAEINCCQYKKNPTTGITCQTVGKEICPLIRNNNELDKIYEGVECNYTYNDSGRNPCVSPK
jgi:hypothetical protein